MSFIKSPVIKESINAFLATIKAMKVTTRYSQRIDSRSGKEVKQGFLLYWVDTDRARISISSGVQFPLIVDSCLANSMFTLMNNTIMRAKKTANGITMKLFLITCQTGPFSCINCFHGCQFKIPQSLMIF